MSNISLQLDFSANQAVLDGVRGKLSSIKSAFGGLAQAAAGFEVAAKFKAALASGIAFNSKLEEIRRGLVAVTGSAGLAGVRLDALGQLARNSRFDLGDLGQVSRQLEVMTSGALAFGAGLKLVTDVASGTQVSLQETAAALGRVYGQIQSGDSEMGRGLQQLVMMGAINATTKNQVEDLARAGAKSSQIWDTLAAALGKFSGQTEAGAQTMQGTLDQLHKAFEDALGAGTRKLFGQLQPILQGLTDSLNQNGARAAIISMGKSIGDWAALLAKLSAALVDCAPAWSSITGAIKVFIGIKVGNFIGSLIARGREFMATTLASAGAIRSETSALEQNTAAALANGTAKRVSDLSASFAPARLPGRESGMRDPITGRFRRDPNASGSMRTKTYTSESLAETLSALDAQAAAAGTSAGMTYAQNIKTAIKSGLVNAGAILAAGLGGWEAGTAIGHAINAPGRLGQSSMDWTTDEQMGAAEDAHIDNKRLQAGLIEQIANLDSVAKKTALIKQLEERIAQLREESGKGGLSALQRGMMAGDLMAYQALLRTTRNKSDGHLVGEDLYNQYKDRLVRDKPIQASYEKEKKEHDDQNAFEEQLAAAETYAEKLKIVQSELAKVDAALAKINSPEKRLEAGDEGYEKQLDQRKQLDGRRGELARQNSELGRESKKENTEKSTRWDEYRLELQILNARAAGNAAGEASAEKELAIRKKTAELLQIARTPEERATAGQRAKEFVDAQAAADVKHPGPLQHFNEMQRIGAGNFIGGVTDALANRRTVAAEKSLGVLQNIDKNTSRPTSGQAKWSES